MDEDQIGEYVVHWSHRNHSERDDAYKKVSEVVDVPPYSETEKDESAIEIEGKVKVKTGETPVGPSVTFISPSQVVDVGVPADYQPYDD